MKIRWYTEILFAIIVVWILPAYATAAETGKGVEKFKNLFFENKKIVLNIHYYKKS